MAVTTVTRDNTLIRGVLAGTLSDLYTLAEAVGRIKTNIARLRDVGAMYRVAAATGDKKIIATLSPIVYDAMQSFATSLNNLSTSIDRIIPKIRVIVNSMRGSDKTKGMYIIDSLNRLKNTAEARLSELATQFYRLKKIQGSMLKPEVGVALESYAHDVYQQLFMPQAPNIKSIDTSVKNLFDLLKKYI